MDYKSYSVARFPTLSLLQVIRACCSPLEAVAFLNNLYKIMDRRLDKFDVYKVESISDTYLVASGAWMHPHRKPP